MEIVRYMTLAGLLFLIGAYGALTRRSFAGVLLSLSVSTAGLALAFVTFNRLIQPGETNGYFFALVMLTMSVVYGAFIAQFVRRGGVKQSSERDNEAKATTVNKTMLPQGLLHDNDSESVTAKAQVRFSRRESEGFTGLVTFSASFAFQVSALMVFVVGYLLMRLSVVSALAFLVGVGALSHMLHRRKEARRSTTSSRKRTEVADPDTHVFSVLPTRTDKV